MNATLPVISHTSPRILIFPTIFRISEFISNSIVLLVIIVSIIVIILNFTKKSIKLNKLLLVVIPICLLIAVVNLAGSLSTTAVMIPGTEGYFGWYIYNNYIVKIMPIILIVCWIILFRFYKKIKKQN